MTIPANSPIVAQIEGWTIVNRRWCYDIFHTEPCGNIIEFSCWRGYCPSCRAEVPLHIMTAFKLLDMQEPVE